MKFELRQTKESRFPPLMSRSTQIYQKGICRKEFVSELIPKGKNVGESEPKSLKLIFAEILRAQK